MRELQLKQSIESLFLSVREVNQELIDFVQKHQGVLSDTKSKIYRINLDLMQFQKNFIQEEGVQDDLVQRGKRVLRNLSQIQENFNAIMVSIDINRKQLKNEEFLLYIQNYINMNGSFLIQDLESLENENQIALKIEKFQCDKKYKLLESSQNQQVQRLNSKESFEFPLYNPQSLIQETRSKALSYQQQLSILSSSLECEAQGSVYQQDQNSYLQNGNFIKNGLQSSLEQISANDLDIQLQQKYLDDYLIVKINSINHQQQVIVTFMNYCEQQFQKYKCSECKIFFQQINMPILNQSSQSDNQSVISNYSYQSTSYGNNVNFIPRTICTQCYFKQNKNLQNKNSFNSFLANQDENFIDKKLIYEFMSEYVFCSSFKEGCKFKGSLGQYLYYHLGDEECKFQNIESMGDDVQYIITHQNLFNTIEEIHTEHINNSLNQFTYVKQLQNRQIDKEFDNGQIKITTHDITFVTDKQELEKFTKLNHKDLCQICDNQLSLVNRNICNICCQNCCSNCSKVKIMGNKVCDVCLTMILQNLKGGDQLYYLNSAIEWGMQKTIRLMHIVNFIKLQVVPRFSKQLNEFRNTYFDQQKNFKDDMAYQKLLIIQERQSILEEKRRAKEIIDKDVDYIQLQIQRIEKKMLKKRELLQELEEQIIQEQNNVSLYEKCIKDLEQNPELKKIPHYKSALESELLLKSLIVFNSEKVNFNINSSKESVDVESSFSKLLNMEDNIVPSIFQNAINKSQIKKGKKEKGNLETDAKCQDCQIY